MLTAHAFRTRLTSAPCACGANSPPAAITSCYLIFPSPTQNLKITEALTRPPSGVTSAPLRSEFQPGQRISAPPQSTSPRVTIFSGKTGLLSFPLLSNSNVKQAQHQTCEGAAGERPDNR